MTPLDLAQRTVALRASLDRALSGLWSRDEGQAEDALYEYLVDHGHAMARTIADLPALIAAWRSTAAEIRSRGDGQRADGVDGCAADLEAAIGNVLDVLPTLDAGRDA